MRFTGSIEARGPELDEPIILPPVEWLDAQTLMERVIAQLELLPPGTRIRLDLLSWAEATE